MSFHIHYPGNGHNSYLAKNNHQYLFETRVVTKHIAICVLTIKTHGTWYDGFSIGERGSEDEC